MNFYGNLFRQNYYNRESAVKYAIEYALKPNPDYKYIYFHGDGGGDCSNFISQCLRAGGAPMAFDSPRPWWYKKNNASSTKDDIWSVSWDTEQ